MVERVREILACSIKVGKMASRFSSRHSLHILQRLDEDRLLLGPLALGPWIGYTFILIGSLVILSKPSNGSVWIFGLFFALIGCLTRFGPPTTLWDKKTGFLTIRRFHFLDKYPLLQIKDVRVIRGKYVFDQQRIRLSYQSYNLVLRLDNDRLDNDRLDNDRSGNDYEEQLNLLENGAAPLQIEYGRTIAEFLGVPFVDESETAAERHSQSVLQPEHPKQRPLHSEQADANRARWASQRAQRKASRQRKRQ
jgi:hypothetical protein